jgi:hypothetical protein
MCVYALCISVPLLLHMCGLHVMVMVGPHVVGLLYSAGQPPARDCLPSVPRSQLLCFSWAHALLVSRLVFWSVVLWLRLCFEAQSTD